jgi:hypothetical protein
MDIVQELEHYLSKNTLDQFVKEMMVQCLKDKPEEPSRYLLKYIFDKNANQCSDEVAVASTPENLHAAVSSPDPAIQKVGLAMPTCVC